LELVPERYGVVRGCWRHFVPRPAGDPIFSERMTARLCAPAFPGNKTTIYHAHQKVAHRADDDVVIESGNHNAAGERLEPIRGWHPIEVHHFSLRSAEQVAQKARGGWLRNTDEELVDHQIRLDRAVDDGQTESFFESHVVADDALERGLRAGTLALDTRLRDVLRRLRSPDGEYRSAGASPLAFPVPDVADAAAYAAEASVLVGIDGIVRAEQRVDALEARLARLRTLPPR
jgi:hypothetical protein